MPKGLVLIDTHLKIMHIVNEMITVLYKCVYNLSGDLFTVYRYQLSLFIPVLLNVFCIIFNVWIVVNPKTNKYLERKKENILKNYFQTFII